MKYGKQAVWAAILAVPFAAEAQGLVTQRSISTDAAWEAATAALAQCRKGGHQVSVTVLDRFARTRVILNDDGANPHSFEHSLRKAYTALTYRTPSGEYGRRPSDPRGERSGRLDRRVGLTRHPGLACRIGRRCRRRVRAGRHRPRRREAEIASLPGGTNQFCRSMFFSSTTRFQRAISRSMSARISPGLEGVGTPLRSARRCQELTSTPGSVSEIVCSPGWAGCRAGEDTASARSFPERMCPKEAVPVSMVASTRPASTSTRAFALPL